MKNAAENYPDDSRGLGLKKQLISDIELKVNEAYTYGSE